MLSWPYNNKKQQQPPKKTCKILDFAFPAEHGLNLKECEKKAKYLDFARECKKNMEYAGDNYNTCNWYVWNSNKRITKETGEPGIWATSGDHPNYNIVENSQNIEKSPGDLRRLAVTQNPVKYYYLTLMGKILKE